MCHSNGNIDVDALKPTFGVALCLHLYTIPRVDPLVSLRVFEKVPNSTSEIVGSFDKQIEETKEVMELPVKRSELFEVLSIAQPKGVLLYGPPGTGMPLLACAVAYYTECRLHQCQRKQTRTEEGSRMIQEHFVIAREQAPSIIFMDEIDVIGCSSGESGSSGGGSEAQ